MPEVTEFTTGEPGDTLFELRRPPWQAQAACHPDVIPPIWQEFGDHPVDLFYPDRGNRERQWALIRALCGSCPVQAECAAHGVQHEQFGVWGAQTTKQLRRERKRLKIRMVTPEIDPYHHQTIGTFIPPGHGTEARYHQHWREGNKPCEACAEAHRIYRTSRTRRESCGAE